MCSEVMTIHAKLVKTTLVFCMCCEVMSVHAKLVRHPSYVNVESITPDHHVVLQNDELSRRCILRENMNMILFVRDHLIMLPSSSRKIRCIKGLTSHAIHNVTGYSLSCAFDLHLQCTGVISITWHLGPGRRHDCLHHMLQLQL